MRKNGIYVYSIGLSTSADMHFLKEIADDPGTSDDKNPTWYDSQYQGAAYYVPDCPSDNCTTELKDAFKAIAARILLRLTK